MDWTPLVTALIGVGGVALGSLLTHGMRSWMDHRHWLRGQRADAYSALLSAYEDYTNAVSGFTERRLSRREWRRLSSQRLGEVYSSLYRLVQVRARIPLFGSKAAREAAWRLQGAAANLTKAIKKGRRSDLDPLVEAVAEAHAQFVIVAGETLKAKADK